MVNSNQYWKERYANGGNSGSGSYGENAKHKADVINDYIKKFNVKTISDFGCGDGNQISLLVGFDKYMGFDVSAHALYICHEKFKENKKMNFCSLMSDLPIADLCLSLDVLYHILDQSDYDNYMKTLFNKSNKYVLIFSSNHDDNNHNAQHIFHRKFTDWVEKNENIFELVESIDNYLLTSAKFFLYKKIE